VVGTTCGRRDTGQRGIRGAAKDPVRSKAEALRRARTKVRRYCTENRLRFMWTFTYRGDGEHDLRKVRRDVERLLASVRASRGKAFPYLWVPELHKTEHGIHVHMGMRQAAEAGRWLNRAPTGYAMRDAMLIPGELAPIVRRIFELRAAGVSLPEIEAQVGIGYSTVRHIVGNRVYLGQVRLRDEWFPGIHEPLVSAELFEAAARAHLPGRRRGRDLLSGRVRCGLCGRVATVDYNERGQALYKCKHRGRGCGQPARSARGLCRAALLGLRVVKEDAELQEAIRDELDALFDGEEEGRRAAEREAALTSLRQKQRKLLDLHYEDRISAKAFGAEEARIAAQIRSLDADAASAAAAAREREEREARFNEVVDVLTTADVEELWAAATGEERRVLVEDLVEAVSMFPDHLEVKVGGAPPLLVELGEVALRDPGTSLDYPRDIGMSLPVSA
jgi:hypothetical protein